MDYTLIFGVFGATIILVAFILNNAGKLSRQSLSYDLANMFGSFILIVYSVLIASIPFIVLNTVWFLFAAFDVSKRLFQIIKK